MAWGQEKEKKTHSKATGETRSTVGGNTMTYNKSLAQKRRQQQRDSKKDALSKWLNKLGGK